MSDSLDALEDCQLIARYCAGDQQAGNLLCERHAGKLLAWIKHLLRCRGLDRSLAEDGFQEVWLALVAAHYHRLEHFDPARGRLDTYLHKLAWRIVDKRYDPPRPGRRETQAEAPEPVDPGANAAEAEAELAELREELTPQERRWLDEQMGEAPVESQPPLSAGNESVLKYRVRQKWDEHFNPS